MVALLLPALLLAAPLQTAGSKKPATPYTAPARKWAHESSDLPVDPRFHFGSLPNGLRYVWVQNREPPRQLLLRLHVDVGSLVEHNDELGVAHFCEHMAFNGSKNFKAGTLVPVFQKEGIRFGSDVNAHTGFSETVYELDLPDDEPKRLERALTWFRDVVDGLKFEPKEVQAEKGVVDAEQQVRGGAGFDLLREAQRQLFDGSRYPRRIPIGEKPVRDKFDQKLCVAFYDRWYRPENATFLVVGDLDGKDPTPLLQKAFGEARGRGEHEDVPSADLDHLSFAKCFFTAPLGGGAQVHFGRMHARLPTSDDSKTRTNGLAVALVGDVLENRLNELVPRPFVLADVGTGDGFHPDHFLREHAVDGVSIQLVTTPEVWPLALTVGEHQLRKLLERGLTDDEWKAALARLDERIAPRKDDKTKSEPALSNHALLGELLRACSDVYVPMDPAADRAWTAKTTKTVTKEAALAAFKAEWERGKLFVYGTGSLDLRDAAKEEFQDAWKSATTEGCDVKPVVRNDLSVLAPKREKKVAGGDAKPSGEGADKPSDAPKSEPAKPFPYALADGTPATKESTKLDAIAAQRVVFDNGVRALLKFVEGHEGRFHFEVRFGEGTFALEPARAPVAKATRAVLLEAGAKKCNVADLRSALATAGGSLRFDVETDACVFDGSSHAAGGEAGLRRALEAVVALLRDGAVDALKPDEYARHLAPHVRDLDRPTFHNERTKFFELISNGDPRFTPFVREEATKVTLDEVKRFVASQLDGPLDVTVVGELPLDLQLRHVASTLGTLPPRRAAAPIPDDRRNAAPPKTGLHEPGGCIDLDGKDCHVLVCYPCGDAIDVKSERTLELLGDVASDRLREDVREKLGATYSPHGRAWGDPALRGRGLVELELAVEPAKLKETVAAVVASMENLAKNGMKKEELDRIRAARAGNPEALAHDLDFWTSELRRAWRQPAVLEDLRDLRRWYDKVTLGDLNALAKSVLAKERASILEVTPR
jgi:zinc protease